MDLFKKKVFDFNIHLPVGSDGLDQRHHEDMEMEMPQIAKAISFYHDDLKTLKGGNYMLFNQHITETDGFKEQMDKLRTSGTISEKSCFTLLLDFRHKNAMNHISTAHIAGVKGIKFHSYLQRIEESDIDYIVALCKEVERLGMFICIDASYGTTYLYKYDNLLLATRIAEIIKNAPIILLHSGGARVLEAMLIADMQENIYMETSLTTPFYEGSSLWQDLAFAWRKLNCERVLYATDFPYITLKKSFEAHEKLFEQFEFTEKELDKVLFGNALKLLSSL